MSQKLMKDVKAENGKTFFYQTHIIHDLIEDATKAKVDGGNLEQTG